MQSWDGAEPIRKVIAKWMATLSPKFATTAELTQRGSDMHTCVWVADDIHTLIQSHTSTHRTHTRILSFSNIHTHKPHP